MLPEIWCLKPEYTFLMGKRIFHIALFIALLIPAGSFAQKERPPGFRLSNDTFNYDKITPIKVDYVVKTNPFAMLWGTVPLSAEYRLLVEVVAKRNQSAVFGGSYLGRSPLISLLIDEDSISNQVGYQYKIAVSGFRFQAAYRFYINPMTQFIIGKEAAVAPNGFYISPHFSYAEAKISERFSRNFNYLNISQLNVNLLGGYQYLYEDFLVLDVFAGLGYKKNTWLEVSPTGRRFVTPFDGEDNFYTSDVKISLGFALGIAF